MATFGLSSGVTSREGGYSSSSEVIDSSTPYVAAADGNLSLLQQSISQLPNQTLETPDENGYTILMAAAAYSQLHVLQWIIETVKATTSPSDCHGRIKQLVGATDSDGDAALHHTTTAASAKVLVEQFGADPDVTGSGKTALQAKQEELAELLEDDDMDDDDVDVVQAKELIEYFSTVKNRAQ